MATRQSQQLGVDLDDPGTITPAGTVARQRAIDPRAVASFAQRYAIIIVTAIVLIVLSLTSRNFLTVQNILNVIDLNAYIGITAVGITLVIIAGGFDLSVGAVFAFAGVTSAYMTNIAGPLVGIGVGLLAGVVLGFVNGWLVTGVKVNSFLATLASGMAIGGLSVAISGGFLIDASASEGFVWLGRYRLFGLIPMSVILFLLVSVVFGIVLSRSVFGRHIYAVGGNPEAARVSGIAVSRVFILTMVICGGLAALAGVLEASRSGVGQANVGGTMLLPLDAIAAAVLGGTSIAGGVGTIWRTFLGVMLLALIKNGFNLMGVAPHFQVIVLGLVIIVAVAISSRSIR